MVQVKATLNIKTPMLPNFFIIADERDGIRSIPISSVSDEELKQIGINWTNLLIGKAQKMRQEKK